MLLDGKFIKQGDFDTIFESKDERIQNFYDYNFIQ
jgi:phospholipid/cholesterol/gamma-HCH transport system ATP-binding protein